MAINSLLEGTSPMVLPPPIEASVIDFLAKNIVTGQAIEIDKIQDPHHMVGHLLSPKHLTEPWNAIRAKEGKRIKESAGPLGPLEPHSSRDFQASNSWTPQNFVFFGVIQSRKSIYRERHPCQFHQKVSIFKRPVMKGVEDLTWKNFHHQDFPDLFSRF